MKEHSAQEYLIDPWVKNPKAAPVRGPLDEGDRVLIHWGSTPVEAVIIDDRGTLGVGGSTRPRTPAPLADYSDSASCFLDICYNAQIEYSARRRRATPLAGYLLSGKSTPADCAGVTRSTRDAPCSEMMRCLLADRAFALSSHVTYLPPEVM